MPSALQDFHALREQRELQARDQAEQEQQKRQRLQRDYDINVAGGRRLLKELYYALDDVRGEIKKEGISFYLGEFQEPDGKTPGLNIQCLVIHDNKEQSETMIVRPGTNRLWHSHFVDGRDPEYVGSTVEECTQFIFSGIIDKKLPLNILVDWDIMKILDVDLRIDERGLKKESSANRVHQHKAVRTKPMREHLAWIYEII